MFRSPKQQPKAASLGRGLGARRDDLVEVLRLTSREGRVDLRAFEPLEPLRSL